MKIVRATLSALLNRVYFIIAYLFKFVKPPTFQGRKEYKMPRITEKDLYEFVYRADTAQKISTAERWLNEHKHLTSRSTLDELIAVLNRTAKRLFRARMAEFEEKFYGSEAVTNV